MSTKYLIIGAGGHAKVIIDILSKNNVKDIVLLDDARTESIYGFPIVGKVSDAEKYIDRKAIIAIGSSVARKKISEMYSLNYGVAIHPTAVIGLDVEINEGTVVMANSVINSGSHIGKHCIINTGSIVEHDNKISNFAHICPGVQLGGSVEIGESTWVGIGATVINNIKISNDVLVGAGAIVLNDINISGIYKGAPVKK